jgi:vacuolar-type H+-ATPase subunit E/Vma4
MESTWAITEMILEEAKLSAKNIFQEAKKSAEDVLEKQRQLGVQKGKESAQLLLKKTQKEAEFDKLRTMANAKIKADWVILSKKDAWIDNVLNGAKNNFKILTGTKKYIPILEKLIIDAGLILGGKELEVMLNKRDSKLPLKLEKLAKVIGDKTGVETKLSMVKDASDVIGGAILKTANGSVVMDNTFDDMLVRREKDLRLEVAKILFK